MSKSPILPIFPNNIKRLENEADKWTALQTQWNESMRILTLFHNTVHSGIVGLNYQVSGSIPTTASIDMTSITVTAVAQTVAKLLHDLKIAGIIDVKELG